MIRRFFVPRSLRRAGRPDARLSYRHRILLLWAIGVTAILISSKRAREKRLIKQSLAAKIRPAEDL